MVNGAMQAHPLARGDVLLRRVGSERVLFDAPRDRAHVLVGLGQSLERPRIRVVWPSGHAEEWADVAIDRYTTLAEGTGK